MLQRLPAQAPTDSRKLQHLEKLAGLKFEGIDVLNLSLGKARFTDLTDPSHSQEFNYGIRDRVFKNIQSEGDLYAALLLLGLQNGGFNLPAAPAPAPPMKKVTPGRGSRCGSGASLRARRQFSMMR